jgi:hypothetical protein
MIDFLKQVKRFLKKKNSFKLFFALALVLLGVILQLNIMKLLPKMNGMHLLYYILGILIGLIFIIRLAISNVKWALIFSISLIVGSIEILFPGLLFTDENVPALIIVFGLMIFALFKTRSHSDDNQYTYGSNKKKRKSGGAPVY